MTVIRDDIVFPSQSLFLKHEPEFQFHRGLSMSEDGRRVIGRVALIFASITMLSLALFKMFWLLMGSLALNGGPLPKIYLITLVEAPAYLASALSAWKWPWVAGSIAGLTLLAIAMRIYPKPVPPYENYLDFEYLFTVAGAVAFFAAKFIHRSNKKNA